MATAEPSAKGRSWSLEYWRWAMELRISRTLRCSIGRDSSFKAEAKRAGAMGRVSADIVVVVEALDAMVVFFGPS